jgi:hypothetical protein
MGSAQTGGGLWQDYGETEMSDPRLARITEIDLMFAEASGWGSWMVMCANEREALVDALKRDGHEVEHKYQARTGTGRRVS